MNSIPYKARYAKLGWKVGKVNFDISNFVWRSVANLRLLRSCADLFSHRMSQEKVVRKAFIYHFFVATNQSNVLTLYV